MVENDQSAVLTELVECISRFLARRWGRDARHIADKILKQTRNREPAWYSVELELGGEQAVFWLPGAITCAARCGRESTDSFETVIRAIALSLGTFQEIEIPNDVREAIHDSLNWLLRQITTGFVDRIRATPSAERGTCQAIDVFWDQMRLARPADFVSALFDSWTGDTSNADASAALLDFALRLRQYPPPLDVMRDERFVNLAFNTDICARHWLVSKHALFERGLQEYAEELRSTLTEVRPR